MSNTNFFYNKPNKNFDNATYIELFLVISRTKLKNFVQNHGAKRGYVETFPLYHTNQTLGIRELSRCTKTPPSNQYKRENHSKENELQLHSSSKSKC